jgi:DNA modification methylase
MIFTDPPYGHSNHEGDWNARLNEHRGIEGRPILNDDQDSMRYVVDGMLTFAVPLLDKESAVVCCCCGGGGPRPTFAWIAQRLDMDGLEFFHSVIWDKLNPGLGWRYRRQHEMVMIAIRKGGKLRWANEKRAVPNIVSMMPPRERLHPNEKPVELCQHFIELHTKPGDIVLDPFMGSGSTGIAALKLGRRFIGIDLDQEHFHTAAKRIEEASRQPSLLQAAPVKSVQEEFIL